MSEAASLNVVELATELTIAWLGNQNNRIAAEEVPNFLQTMHRTLSDLSANGATGTIDADEERTDFHPAVSVRKSLTSKDVILSMIDGKAYKTLTRHLSTNGLTPDEYRRRYNLKPDYPMVAESYSEARRAMAKKIGLGARGRQSRAAQADAGAPTKARRAPRKAETPA